METNKNLYGYCPTCGKPGFQREQRIDGNDTCEAGHCYPSRDVVDSEQAMKIKLIIRLSADNGKLLDELIERLGENPEEWVD